MKARFFILSVFMSFSMASATIINVPGDSATIQGGINGSIDGDTVLVQPGTYVENINFNGHNIVLGSLFLTTGDTSYISQTIIDGDSAGTVVTFENGEDSTAIITGFMIQNGYGRGGGGIRCIYSSPVITNNVIFGNKTYGEAQGYGGGIHCAVSNSSISNNTIYGNWAWHNGAGIYCHEHNSTINNNIITGNSVEEGGGGIYISHSKSIVSNNTISDNSAGIAGGGINIYNCDSLIVVNNIIIQNSAIYYGGGISLALCFGSTLKNNSIVNNFAVNSGGGIGCVYYSEPTAINSILWANNPNEIYIDDSSPVITYCDIQDTLWPGEGNISCDPQFCEPDSGNFDLNAFSCCVGTGQNGEDIGARGIGCWNCEGYVVGDINNSGGYNGLDITYGISYFKGGPPPPYECVCTPGNIWYASGDVNGSCSYNGLDITYGVSYLKGIHAELFPCPDCPPVR